MTTNCRGATFVEMVMASRDMDNIHGGRVNFETGRICFNEEQEDEPLGCGSISCYRPARKTTEAFRICEAQKYFYVDDGNDGWCDKNGVLTIIDEYGNEFSYLDTLYQVCLKDIDDVYFDYFRNYALTIEISLDYFYEGSSGCDPAMQCCLFL